MRGELSAPNNRGEDGRTLKERFDYIEKYTGKTQYLNTPQDILAKNYIEAETNEAIKLAEDQSTFGKFVNWAAQSVVGEIVLGTVEGAGYLLDVQHWGSKLLGYEGDYGNWLSDLAESGKEGIR